MRVAAVALVASLSAGAFAEEGTKGVAIGATVPDFTGKDVDGKEFRLSAMRTATKEAALASVLAAAQPKGGPLPDPKDSIEALARLRDAFGTEDREKRVAFVREAAKPWGLLPTSKAVDGLKTLDDVATWIEKASATTIVFVIWSPKCPYVRGYDDRIQAAVADAGARLYAVSSNARITAEEVKAYVVRHGTPYRIVVDPRQEICDLLGGRNTPEAVVVDAQGVLRYRGGIDDDPLENKKETERVQWLREALVAVRDGKPVPRPTTTPLGCPVRRK